MKKTVKKSASKVRRSKALASRRAQALRLEAELKAKRSIAAKKAAATRRANLARKKPIKPAKPVGPKQAAKSPALKRAETIRYKAELKARRSAAAKKGAITRRANLLRKNLEAAEKRMLTAAKRGYAKAFEKSLNEMSGIESQILELESSLTVEPEAPHAAKPEAPQAVEPEAPLAAEPEALAEPETPEALPPVGRELVRYYLLDKIRQFAKRMKISAGTYELNSTLLADDTVAVEATFLAPKKYDKFLRFLSEEVQSWGPQYKVSIAAAFDPSAIVQPIAYTGTNEISIGEKNPYDLYRGRMDVPTNFSADVTGQFANMRFEIVPALVERAGVNPSAFRLIVLHGDTIMGRTVSRRLSHRIDYGDE